MEPVKILRFINDQWEIVLISLFLPSLIRNLIIYFQVVKQEKTKIILALEKTKQVLEKEKTKRKKIQGHRKIEILKKKQT
jgi:hypothetical protein